MLKHKLESKLKYKNIVKINKNISDEDEGSDFYDSMIENGTSDENDLDEILSEASSNENDTDDGFSDKEADVDLATQNLNITKKRKNEENSKPAKKKFKNEIPQSKSLFKAPTVEEINKLRETETQFHSNLFRLQIEEMLQELRMKNKLKKAINEWLDEFNSFLNELESQEEKLENNNLTWINEKEFKSSFQRKRTIKQKFQFQFLKPFKSAIFVGSIVSNTIIDSKFNVDVCVEIPAKTFQKGDYLNMIYEEKRSLYMLYLAHKMVSSKKFNSNLIHYNYFQNNKLKPVLEIDIGGKYENRVVFRIFPVPEENSFKLNRFVPWNSNIRASLFEENISKEDEILYATPNYNSNVLFDLTMKKNNALIENVLGESKNLQEGLILLKIWLKQRSLNDGSSGFGNHILTLFVVCLYQQRKLHAGMSSYQIARNVWYQFASSSWNEKEKSLSLFVDSEIESNQPTVEQMHTYFDIVFLDCSGFLNICADLSMDIYLRIKYESSRAIELLNDNKVNSFQQLFLTKLPHFIQFDHIFGFKRSVIRTLLDQDKHKADKHNFAGCWLPHTIKIVTNILRKGLGDRILSMTPLETPSEPWSLTSYPRTINNTFRIGLILNSARALDVLDKGPQANDLKAIEFRDFWGEKSQLRRFQDGSITEACMWAPATESLKEKRLVVKQIVLHLLHHHFQLTKIHYLADQFDCAYEACNSNLDAEYYTVDVIKNFDDIGKKLRALEELSLDVTGIQGISPVFRYAEPVPILNNAKGYHDAKNDKFIFRAYNVNHGIIELGTSGKWPNDLTAFRKLKTAFHIQLARSLKKSYSLQTRSGIDGVHILNNGYLYKIEISHPKEIALLRKNENSKGIIQYTDTEDSLQLEKCLNILPKVTSALHGLYQQFSSYGPTVMIAKRWLNSQLIDSYHWPEECTELLIASQYLKQNTLNNPCQPQTGFLRFLYLLANTNWKTEMFILNFNEDMEEKEITELEERFTKERDTFPNLFIATSFDEKKYGLWWCKESPNTHILARVTILARHALEILKPTFTFERTMEIYNLFLPSLDGYDVIITLRKTLIQPCLAHSFNSSKKQITNSRQFVPKSDFNPVLRAFNQLREGYSNFALFFYNPYGGSEIAVKWKPNIFESKEFNLNSINACHPLDDDKVTCKIEPLIEDFKIILEGLFHEITIR